RGPVNGLFAYQDYGRFEIPYQLSHGGSDESVTLGELKLSSYPVDQQEPQFEMSLEMWPREEGLLCVWRYDASVLDRQDVVRWASVFETVAAAVADQPGRAVATIPAVPDDDLSVLD